MSALNSSRAHPAPKRHMKALTTGLHSILTHADNGQINGSKPKRILSPFLSVDSIGRATETLPAKMGERIAQRHAGNLHDPLRRSIQFQD